MAKTFPQSDIVEVLARHLGLSQEQIIADNDEEELSIIPSVVLDNPLTIAHPLEGVDILLKQYPKFNAYWNSLTPKQQEQFNEIECLGDVATCLDELLSQPHMKECIRIIKDYASTGELKYKLGMSIEFYGKSNDNTEDLLSLEWLI